MRSFFAASHSARLLSAVAAVVAFAVVAIAQPAALGAVGAEQDRGPGRYIVTLVEGADMSGVHIDHGIGAGAVTASYRRALHGFAARMPAGVATRLAGDPRVRSVEADRWLTIATTQWSPPWGLDRIDERPLPMSDSYSYGTTGAGVKAYVVDTGIRRTHQDFGTRVATGWYAGPPFVDDGVFDSTDDCNGHGTHVAGTLGGTSFGVAKGVTIVPVKALGLDEDDNECGQGGWSVDVIAGIEWMIDDHAVGEPAVANLSFGQPATDDVTLETAITNAMADGITFVVAAGNEDQNACGVSPARMPDVLTVGATDEQDERVYFSNYGSCLDLFAPGVQIKSAGITSNIAPSVQSGTSMAAPHVAGAAARYLETTPTAAPANVATVLTTSATRSVVTAAGYCSPADLLYVDDAWPVADTPASRLTISASSSAIAYGRSTTLYGRLTSDGDPVGCEVVRVQRRRAGTSTWEGVTTRSTDSYGRVFYTASPTVNTYFRLRYTTGAYGPSSSGISLVGVSTRVSGALNDPTVRRDSRAYLSGLVRPSHARHTVVLQRRIDGTWRNVQAQALDRESRYRFRLGTSRRGTFRYRAVMPAHTDHLRGTSPVRILTVG